MIAKISPPVCGDCEVFVVIMPQHRLAGRSRGFFMIAKTCTPGIGGKNAPTNKLSAPAASALVRQLARAELFPDES